MSSQSPAPVPRSADVVNPSPLPDTRPHGCGMTQIEKTTRRGAALRPASSEVLVHIAAALTAHERRLRRDGAPIPAVFADLLELVRQLARTRHDATPIGAREERTDDVGVTDRLLLTKAETAERLGVSVRTVERLVTAGHLPQVGVEGARRFRVVDVTTYVANLVRTPVGQHGATPTGPGAAARPTSRTAAR